MLHSVFEWAVKDRLILRNPTEDCIAPKVQKIEMQILPPEHIKDYLDAADKRGLLPMFYLELVTGLRKGEITALLWSDLDARNNTISVSKQSVKNPNGELNSADVKTVSSMLGHYDAGFTLRTYTHATRQKQDEAAQTMGSFMAQVM